MKISAISSGGFAGLTEQYEIDTQVHPQGSAIEAAVREAGFFRQGQHSSEPIGADMVHWRITIDSPEWRGSITFAEDGSAPWQELLTRLRQQA